MAKNSTENPFGTTTPAWHGGRRGLLAGSTAGSGGGDHSLPRAPTRGTPRYRRRSAPSIVNAVRTGAPTATVIAAGIGTPGWEPWNCAFPRSERGVTFLRQRRTGAQATQREGVAGGDPAGLRGGCVHEKGGRSDQVPRLRRDFEESGLTHLLESGPGGEELPGPAIGRRAVSHRLVLAKPIFPARQMQISPRFRVAHVWIRERPGCG